MHSRWPRSAGPVRRGACAALVAALAALALSGGRARGDGEELPADTDTTNITASVRLPAPGQLEVLPAVRRPFKPGERLKFSVQYGFIKAGSAYLEVPQILDWKGHRVYDLVARAESNAFFSRFYKVRNRIDSYWDVDGMFSRRYVENRREGGYRSKEEIVFDHDRHEAHYRSGAVLPVPPDVQDALSSFYFTRTQALPIGGSIVFDYHASHKSQPLEVRVLGREHVQTPAGEFDCVAVEPVLKAGGIFKNKGRLVIWLTDDDRRMPVLMKSKVVVGSISVVLQEYQEGT